MRYINGLSRHSWAWDSTPLIPSAIYSKNFLQGWAWPGADSCIRCGEGTCRAPLRPQSPTWQICRAKGPRGRAGKDFGLIYTSVELSHSHPLHRCFGEKKNLLLIHSVVITNVRHPDRTASIQTKNLTFVNWSIPYYKMLILFHFCFHKCHWKVIPKCQWLGNISSFQCDLKPLSISSFYTHYLFSSWGSSFL